MAPHLLELVLSPSEVVHAEEAHQQPVRHQHQVTVRPVARVVDPPPQRAPQVAHSTVDVGTGFS